LAPNSDIDSTNLRVLAVIPAYNEQETLAATVEELVGACPHIDYLVVNDGSTDDTEKICRELGLNHVTHPFNTGLSSGFRTGMKYAHAHGYDAVVQFDADGQHRPECLDVMAERLDQTGCDLVLGSRYLAGEKALGMRNVGSRLLRWLIRRTTGVTVTDPTSGLRMYGRRMIGLFADGFDLGPEPDTIALLIRNGASVEEVPITIRERQGGESYLNPFRAARYMFRMCASLVLFQWFR